MGVGGVGVVRSHNSKLPRDSKNETLDALDLGKILVSLKMRAVNAAIREVQCYPVFGRIVRSR